jgi:hypothetical protein
MPLEVSIRATADNDYEGMTLAELRGFVDRATAAGFDDATVPDIEIRHRQTLGYAPTVRIIGMSVPGIELQPV